MLRSTAFPIRLLAATFALGSMRAAAQTDNRPVVVVFTFTNSSIGPKGEFDGLATGIQDLLITDLASNAKVRLVDRARLAEILQEQNLVKNGQVDQHTAVRLGKIFGAQYAITGGFMADGSGSAVLTSRTIDIETSQIDNPEKIVGKTDDVLGMIAQLSSKISSDLNLSPKRASSGDSDGGTGSTAAVVRTASTSLPTAGNPARPANSETFAKELPVTVVQKTMKTKLDAATMKLY